MKLREVNNGDDHNEHLVLNRLLKQSDTGLEHRSHRSSPSKVNMQMRFLDLKGFENILDNVGHSWAMGIGVRKRYNQNGTFCMFFQSIWSPNRIHELYRLESKMTSQSPFGVSVCFKIMSSSNSCNTKILCRWY